MTYYDFELHYIDIKITFLNKNIDIYIYGLTLMTQKKDKKI